MFQLDLKIHSILKKQFVNLLKTYLKLYWNKLILQEQHNLYVFYFNRSISLFFIRQAVLISTALPKYSKISWCDDIIYAHLFLLPFCRNLSLATWSRLKEENSEGGFFIAKRKHPYSITYFEDKSSFYVHVWQFKLYPIS